MRKSNNKTKTLKGLMLFRYLNSQSKKETSQTCHIAIISAIKFCAYYINYFKSGNHLVVPRQNVRSYWKNKRENPRMYFY